MNKEHLTIWANAVKEMYPKCREVGDSCLGTLHAHHIVYKSVDPTKALDLSNGITLCAKHHYELHIEEATDPEHIAYYQKLHKEVKPRPKIKRKQLKKKKKKKVIVKRKTFVPKTKLRKQQ